MTHIDAFEFGSITIDKKTYNHDVYIMPSGKIEEREHSHEITKQQIMHVLKENPDIILIGKGTSGVAKLTEEAKKLLSENKVEFFEDNTYNIVKKFNDLAKKKKVAAIIHTTC